MLIGCQIPFDLGDHHFLLLSAASPNDWVLNGHVIIEEHIIWGFDVVDSLGTSILEADVVAAKLVLLQLSFPLFVRFILFGEGLYLFLCSFIVCD